MASVCDALICITPGGPSTHKIVNAEVLEALGPNGTLINVSRGSVVDEAALIEALEIWQAGLGWARCL
jgi:lactate dehydrogenase-like 2-hydroxyacid dehydrogenase